LQPATVPDEFGEASFFADPYSTYARIRARGVPAWESNSGAWLITRYADVESLLRDARLSKAFQRETPTPFEASVLFQDPPAHTRVRGILNQAFSGGAMQGLEDRVLQIADALIDRMLSGRAADFMSAFAEPLPVAVISGLLGVPPEDAEKLHNLAAGFIVEDSLAPEESQRLQYASIGSMAEYFQESIASRGDRRCPDALGAMMQAHNQVGNYANRLSRDELIGNCILLMVAGHETTVNLLGNGLYLLLRHREQLELLKRRPELWPSAIEEMLRFESPVQLGTFRHATAPIEIAGGTVNSGSAVTAVIGAANRDPEQFPEPDRFDITRVPNRHLAFGMGPHRCLGAALARTEARIAFARLFERLPDLCLATVPAKNWFKLPWLRDAAQAPKWRHNAVTRGLTELKISW
jgi:cytochrome P450